METGLYWCYMLRPTLGRLASLEEARRRLGEIVGPSAIIAAYEGETETEGPAFFFKLTDRATAIMRRDIAGCPGWKLMLAAPRWTPPRSAPPRRRFPWLGRA